MVKTVAVPETLLAKAPIILASRRRATSTRPKPSCQAVAECTSFINSGFPTLKGLLTICTGSLAIAQTGVLDGVQSATNKMALKMLAQVGLEVGITSGVDLAAEFSRFHFDPELVELVKTIMEYIPNPAQPDPFAYLFDGVNLD
ncbi:hypothetical protein EST38_g8775 [Candolleomyces aberdarensis]|uniref:DJ-1/PfpI domain-containing protein n=1 Tax=Candolleomyces aberdarensis TaxID=2316362 RepID=A0A4Q2DCF5_9AGAR|nr:hypothetical protein EST38_g8775 [Candolleomyces aberdarensis]